MKIKTGLRAALLTGAGAAMLVLGLASPALAHVDVSADKTVAGATDVTISFSVEAERGDAGITVVEVVLPAGLPAAAVTAGELPPGWVMTTTAAGIKVAGAALAAGKDADFSLKVARLPTDQPQLVLKTLVTYSDGAVDRWIEIPVAGQPEPPHPAPIIELTSSTPAAASPTVTALLTPPSTDNAVADDQGSSHAGWWIAVAVVVIGGTAGWWIFRRYRRPAA
jgi:hypothetical protein